MCEQSVRVCVIKSEGVAVCMWLRSELLTAVMFGLLGCDTVHFARRVRTVTGHKETKHNS